MDRQRRIWCKLLITAIAAGCTEIQTDRICEETEKIVEIHFSGGDYMSKSTDPDEDKITDISLMIFDHNGHIEDYRTLSSGYLETTGRKCPVKLVHGMEYTLCACVNFGYPVYRSHINELDDIVYHLEYPDEYREGIPMYACKTLTISEESTITLELIRLMAKITLRMDRRKLSDNVEMNVRSVKIGNCPKRMKVFGENKVTSSDECFSSGFSKEDYQTATLNELRNDGLSGEVSLYMFENMQGQFSKEGPDNDSGKVFPEDDPRRYTCSYIELGLEYMSDSAYSMDGNLIYRFYLGEDRNNLDIERNCHYHINICPEDDGLKESSWRVDKSSIYTKEPITFNAYPDAYLRGNIGDVLHLWCEFTPAYAPFDVGVSYMEEDKARGIYDYKIDEDGHGATLTLTGPGRGLVYMEAGPPVNDAALYIIEVNLP